METINTVIHLESSLFHKKKKFAMFTTRLGHMLTSHVHAVIFQILTTVVARLLFWV